MGRLSINHRITEEVTKIFVGIHLIRQTSKSKDKENLLTSLFMFIEVDMVY
jgi:hypothetical protein